MIKIKPKELIIDLNDLTSRFDNDRGFINELLRDFVTDVEKKLNEIHMLLVDDKFDNIGMIVHSLKGSTSYLNIHFMWEAVCLLENAVKRNDIKMMNIYYDIIVEEHKKLSNYLDKVGV